MKDFDVIIMNLYSVFSNDFRFSRNVFFLFSDAALLTNK